MQLLLPARIENGKVIWKDPVKLSKVLSEFNNKDVVVAIKTPRSNRSLSQNNYYWGVIIEVLADYTGYGKTEMHEVLRGKFLSDTREVGGEQIRFSHSTTELDTSEFEKYLSDVREWASSMLNCFIPLPNEIEY